MKQWLSLMALAGLMVLAPAQAQFVNQSDTGGTNITTPTTPPSTANSAGAPPQSIAQAQQFNTDISRAEDACNRSLTKVASLPRVFSRQQRATIRSASSASCQTPECSNLSDLLQRAQDFLSGVDGKPAAPKVSNRSW